MPAPGPDPSPARPATPSPPGSCRCREPGTLPGADDRTARLAHLYLCEGQSTYRIAQATGLDRQRVTRLLRAAGVPLRPRGAGGTRPPRRPDPPGLDAALAAFYLGQRLTAAQVGERIGMPGRTIQDRLRQHGIQPRTRGSWQREDRRSLPSGALRALYAVDGLSADDVGRRLGASRKAVLRAAHELGLAVRAGGAVAQPGREEIRLIEALYRDELVAAALARHAIPRVPPGGPIWQRFPQPLPLTPRLVTDLYLHCGIGLSHIELLTGQPAETVRGFMRRNKISTRPPGGRSPFLRRRRPQPRT
jgi:hypothetical protein